MSAQLQADLDVQLLEPLLRHFVDLIGLQKTMLIVDKWGGLPIYIAKDPDPDSELASLIGLPGAIKLAGEYPGDRPRIPKAGAALRAVRNQRIRAEHAVKSLRQLVLEYKLSERTICDILAAGEPERGQSLGLFD